MYVFSSTRNWILKGNVARKMNARKTRARAIVISLLALDTREREGEAIGVREFFILMQMCTRLGFLELFRTIRDFPYHASSNFPHH